MLEILDSTLREGELFQAFDNETKRGVAEVLRALGPSRVELTVDYPPRTSGAELDLALERFREAGVGVVLHGRACAEDVERIAGHEVEGCGLYIAISKLHRENKLHGITEERALDELCRSVALARSRGIRYIRATLEDASRLYMEEGRAGLDRIGESARRLKAEGATLLSVPDTSGLMTPHQAGSFFRELGEASALPLSAHFHNDYGFASANTVEACLEGAAELQVSIMGIGDRNGIADMYEVIAALEDIHGLRTGVDRSGLRAAYQEFAKVAGLDMNWRHPLSTEAQTIRAGVHQSMTSKRPDGYIPAKKLEHDFDGPRYTVNQFISYNLVRSLLVRSDPAVTKEEAKAVAESIAAAARSEGRVGASRIQEIVFEQTGVEVPRQEIANLFGVQRVYVLMKLRPQSQAARIAGAVAKWADVETVDEVYGELDMVIRARLRDGKENVVSELRTAYADDIVELRTLLTE